jgi:hypothetical protein
MTRATSRHTTVVIVDRKDAEVAQHGAAHAVVAVTKEAVASEVVRGPASASKAGATVTGVRWVAFR